MPTVLRQDGFAVMIYTHDHEPQHVHVWSAGGEIVIDLADMSVRAASGLTSRDARRAQAIVAANQDFLQDEWERIDPVP